MGNKPMTTEELFNKVCSILKEKGRMPEILDYALATGLPIPIKTCGFELKADLGYGASEGIYLDLWIVHCPGGERHRSGLGTFKTLDKSDGAMHTMAGLLADFIIEGYAYIDANLDDFNWEGADVSPLDCEGKRLGWGYSCCGMGTALKRKDELLKKYPQVVIRDNATREEQTFKSRME